MADPVTPIRSEMESGLASPDGSARAHAPTTVLRLVLATLASSAVVVGTIASSVYSYLPLFGLEGRASLANLALGTFFFFFGWPIAILVTLLIGVPAYAAIAAK